MAFVANTGQMAIAFNEEGVNSSGSLTKSLRSPSDMSQARAKAAATICAMASQKKEPVGITVSKVLSQSIPELQSYVQARGETPQKNPSDLAVQAALLRATEIGTVSKAIDTTDMDALGIIEDSEQQHVEDNTAETSGILSPATAGALTLLVQRISDQFKRNGGSGNMRDWVIAVKNYTGVNNFSEVNNGGLVNNAGDVDYGAIYQPTATSDGSDMSSVLYEDAAGNNTSSGGSTFWDNLFTGIDNVVNAVTKVSGAIQQTTGAINTTVGNVNTTAGGIIGQVTDIGGQAGAKAISQYVRDNIVTILAVLAAIIILIVILSRASSR
jgi:hypothetical protein